VLNIIDLKFSWRFSVDILPVVVLVPNLLACNLLAPVWLQSLPNGLLNQPFFRADYLDPEYGETSAEQLITPMQIYRINIK
jgi:hypothetical protein